MDKKIKQLKKIIKETEQQTGTVFNRTAPKLKEQMPLLFSILLINFLSLIAILNNDSIISTFNDYWQFLTELFAQETTK